MTGKGATMDIGAWLRGLGLGKYEAAFRENEIDDTVLSTLTAEDLKDLGVDVVGHRRRAFLSSSKVNFEGAFCRRRRRTSPHTAPREHFDVRALPGGGRHIKNRYGNGPAVDVDQFALMPAAYRSHRL